MLKVTPEQQAKAREIADKHGAAIVAAMLRADQETHLVNAMNTLQNELATLIAKADERDAAIESATKLDNEYRTAFIEHQRKLDSFREKAEALDWLESQDCFIDGINFLYWGNEDSHSSLLSAINSAKKGEVKG